MVLDMDSFVAKLFMGMGDSHNNVDTRMLSDFEMYKWEEVTKGIDVNKVYEDDKVIIFITKMKKGASFGEHAHPDADEFCAMVYGILGDHLNKELKVKGEIMRYSRGVPHHPYAKTDNLFTVTFYK